MQQGQKFNYRQSRNRFVVKGAAKEIAFDEKSRTALQAGIDKLANAVGLTLGPRGNSWNHTSIGYFCNCSSNLWEWILFLLRRFLLQDSILRDAKNR